MKKCVRGCENYSSLYKFPREETDQNRRQEWRTLLNVPDWNRNYNLFACSRHFSSSMRSAKKLKKGAVPDRNLTKQNEEEKAAQYDSIELDLDTQEEFVVETCNTDSDSINHYVANFKGPLGVQIGSYVQTCKYFSDNSPRKQQLREQINCLRLQLNEMIEENKKLKLELAKSKSKEKERELCVTTELPEKIFNRQNAESLLVSKDDFIIDLCD